MLPSLSALRRRRHALLPPRLLLAVLLPPLLLLSGCRPQEQGADGVTEVIGQTMGTFYKVSIYGPSPLTQQELRHEAEQAFAQVINAISTFDENSEISRFNHAPTTEPFEISPYLADVIEYGRLECLRLQGAMDFTVGPLVDLWGFGPEGQRSRIPSEEELQQARRVVGIDKYDLERTQDGKAYLTRTDPGVRLDLSTIGEGMGVDLLYDRLFALGVKNFLVSVAGASKGLGVNAKGVPFRIGIEDPDFAGRSGVHAVVCPQGMAMSTAGSYRNYFERNGVRYSHIIDPATGHPIEHRTVSVTVVARSAVIADAIDTGLMVMGAQKALEWADQHEEAVYVIEVGDDGQLHASWSKNFEQYLKCSQHEEAVYVIEAGDDGQLHASWSKNSEQ